MVDEKKAANFVSDRLGTQYQIIERGESSQPHKLADPVDIWSKEDANFFLNRFNLDAYFWRHLLRNHQMQNNPAKKPQEFNGEHDKLAYLLQTHRLKAFKLNQLSKVSVKSSESKALTFVSGITLDSPREHSKQVSINSERDAENLITGLNQTESFWHEVIRSNDLNTSPLQNQSPPSQVVKGALISGELKVFEKSKTIRAAEKQEELESVPVEEVPLAPQTEPWICIKLVNEAKEAVANQDYWLKDSNGQEYTGKTNNKGEIYLSKVAPGSCEFKFSGIESDSYLQI